MATSKAQDREIPVSDAFPHGTDVKVYDRGDINVEMVLSPRAKPVKTAKVSGELLKLSSLKPGRYVAIGEGPDGREQRVQFHQRGE